MSLKESDLLNTLYKIEKDLDVQSLNVDGLYLWPLLRIQLFFENWTKLSSSTSSIKTQKKSRIANIYNLLLKPILLQIKAQLSDFKMNARLKKSDVLFLSDSMNRRVKIQSGSYIDIFTDLIGNEFEDQNMSWLSLERCPHNIFKYPRAEKSKFIATFLILQKIKQVFIKSPKLTAEVENLLQQIKNQLSLAGFSSASISPFQVRNAAKQLNSLKRSYLKFINIVKPDFVIQTDWYSMSSMALSLAAKELNIPFIDYQHGVQGEAHIAYGNWFKPFSTGTSLLPDVFLCWTESDCKNIRSWLPPNKGRVHCVGNILINHSQKGLIKYENFDKIKNLKIPHVTNILLSLQPSYFLNEKILEQIANFSNNTFWWVRLHPSMINESDIFKSKLKSNFPNLKFNLEIATSSPLPHLLTQVDLHITYNSSVVIEASMMNIPSIILDSDLGMDLFNSYLSSGDALLGVQTILPKNKLSKKETHKESIVSLLRKMSV